MGQVAGIAVPIVTSLIGGAMGGGGKKGGGGASYPSELNDLLGLQYDIAKKFAPMTSAWAQMGNQYMGLGGGGGVGGYNAQTLGGGGGDSMLGTWDATNPASRGPGPRSVHTRDISRFGDAQPYLGRGGINTDRYRGYQRDRITDAAPVTGGVVGGQPGGGNTPLELEDMPALRDILYTPGGQNELLLRRQGETARGQIQESLPVGGVMQSELAKQSRYENENLGAMRVGAREQAARLVLGGGPMITPFNQLGSGAAHAGSIASNLYMGDQAAKGGAMGGLGQMVGMMGASAMGGKGGRAGGGK